MAADYVRECERCGARLGPQDVRMGQFLRYRDWIVCRACKAELLAPLEKESAE